MNFTIDTHLFRELGELLVGRDSTALIELIKNSYDADATRVSVFGGNLHDIEEGYIEIHDDGTGMTSEQFETGFLRIASRLKDEGERRSTRLQRRYTGAKGVGRLAAHKLARRLSVVSTSSSSQGMQTVVAEIDWDVIESFQTLDAVQGTDAISVTVHEADPTHSTGTTIRLSRIRRAWSNEERTRFLSEVHSFTPPEMILAPVGHFVESSVPLFDVPRVRDVVEDAGELFDVQLLGDFVPGDSFWRLIEEKMTWLLEIRSSADDRKVRYRVSPTNVGVSKYPDARAIEAIINHPGGAAGPFFDARVFLRVGHSGLRGAEREWISQNYGIRVYMEGFRVLPYGESRNDWLQIDADYARRSRTLERLGDVEMADVDQSDRDAALVTYPNTNYVGGVFLTHRGAPSLRMLVNREGFVPEAGYELLVDLVRKGIDMCTRAHAAAAQAQREERRRSRKRNDPQAVLGRASEVASRMTAVVEVLKEIRSYVDEKELSLAVQGRLDDAIVIASETIDEAGELMSEQALLRVLASLGTQLSTFIHEVRNLVATSTSIEEVLRATTSGVGRNPPRLTPDAVEHLRLAAVAALELRRTLEREASYLADLVSTDARRRRSRWKLAEKFDSATLLFASLAARRNIAIVNDIPKTYSSPPMFGAELTSVFTNLISNAIKAAGSGGVVRASATSGPLETIVRIENSGVRVSLGDSETWFRPFESTAVDIDAAYSQGMGLGLPITRAILAEYRASIRFVEPSKDFATAIEITFPTKGKQS